ncbi:MAG: hypothetical protein QM602_10325 [Microbacterium sp.]
MSTSGSANASPGVSSNPLARALSGLRLARTGRAVNLLLLDFTPGAVFAGVQTAFDAASMVSAAAQTDVRLLLLRPTRLSDAQRESFTRARLEWLTAHFPDVTWRIVCDDDLESTTYGFDDIWIATHWMTAHALDLAARAGSVDPRRVLYLVQDYEPDFCSSPTDRDAAESTYKAGFTPVVNTRQVASYLERKGFGPVDPRHVFAPRFDSRHLMLAAYARRPRPRATVFFYGRPSKARNLFGLGAAALRRLVDDLAVDSRDVDFVMAGEAGPDLDLGGVTVRNLGVLERDAYFSMISEVDVGLTLQATPHPSHLPFDLAVSGAFAVTNEVDGSRNGMHPRIIAADGTPEALGAALACALRAARRTRRPTAGYLPVREGRLGVSLRTALTHAIAHSALLDS